MGTMLMVWILGVVAPELSLEQSTRNMDRYMYTVAHIESDMNRYASTAKSSASSYFQMTVPAFKTAKKRAARMNWIIKAEYIGEMDYDEQKALVLVDLYQREGTNPFIKLIAEGNTWAGKKAYSRWHHTNTDEATRSRMNEIFKRNYR